MDYEQESSLELNCHSNITPRRQASYSRAAVWFLGTSLRSTEQHLHAESTTTEGAPVAEGLPGKANAIGDSRKNDRDTGTLTTGNSLLVHGFRVVNSRQNLDANQSN